MTSYAQGLHAEELACNALLAHGWTILGRRVRTPAGEIDAIVERNGLLAFIEVKYRGSLMSAAYAVSARQQRRLFAAAAYVLGQNPEWGRAGIRFDVMLVDHANRLRRVRDAIRLN